MRAPRHERLFKKLKPQSGPVRTPPPIQDSLPAGREAERRREGVMIYDLLHGQRASARALDVVRGIKTRT